MSTCALRSPESLYAHAMQLARQDQAPIDRFIAVATEEKSMPVQRRRFLPSAQEHLSPRT